MSRPKKEILPPEHCASVKEYEAGNWWVSKSRKLLDDKECECPICHRKRWSWMPRKKKWKRIRFCCHHVRYTNVPHEEKGDLMTICWQCHDLFHLLLRLESWGGVFKKLGELARTVFFYEGGDTFHPW